MSSALDAASAGAGVGAGASEVQYEVLQEHHIPQVRHLLLTSFFLEEPVCHFSSVQVPGDVTGFLEQILPQCLADGASFVAVTPGSEDATTPEVIGVRLALIDRRKEPDRMEGINAEAAARPGLSAAVGRIVTLLGHMHAGVDFHESYGVDTALRMVILNVRRDHSRRGIARRLVTRCMEHAKERFGAGVASAELTSKYSQRLYAELGYRVDKVVYYDEYKVDGEVVFKRNGSIHDSCQLVSIAL